MKTLILMRHSFAEPLEDNLNDLYRKLTDKGKKAATEKSLLLLKHFDKIDILVTSHAIRAIETSQMLTKELSFEILFKPQEFLFGSYSTQDFLEWLHKLDPQKNSLLVIAHNPEISQLSFRLSQGITPAFQPSSVSIMKYRVSQWNEIEVSIPPEIVFLP